MANQKKSARAVRPSLPGRKLFTVRHPDPDKGDLQCDDTNYASVKARGYSKAGDEAPAPAEKAVEEAAEAAEEAAEAVEEAAEAAAAEDEE